MTMKLMPQASIMSTRVSSNQKTSRWPTPLATPNASPTRTIFHDSESAILRAENR